MKVINTKEAVALSFCAFRVNDGFLKETRRFSEDANTTKFSNKDLLKFFYTENEQYLPEDYVPLVPNDDDKQNAKDAIKFLNKEFSLQLIAGTLNDFIKNLLSSANTEECTTSDLGLLCYVPKVYNDTKNTKEIKKSIKSNFSESRHIAEVGSKIEGMFTITSIRYVEKFGCHVVSGSIEKDLVSFFKEFSQERPMPTIGQTIKIKAKIKKHGENYITKIPETLVNYVRFV